MKLLAGGIGIFWRIFDELWLQALKTYALVKKFTACLPKLDANDDSQICPDLEYSCLSLLVLNFAVMYAQPFLLQASERNLPKFRMPQAHRSSLDLGTLTVSKTPSSH
jgi:hypothetical protein